MKEANSVVDVDVSILDLYEEGIRRETREIIVRRNLLSDDVIGDFLDEIVSNVGNYLSVKPDCDNDELYQDFREILGSEVRSRMFGFCRSCGYRHENVATGEV